MDLIKAYQQELIHSLWNLLGAVMILIVGWAVAILVEVIVSKALELANFKIVRTSTLSKSIKILILIFAVMMSLEHLNVAKITITSTYQIVLGTIGLGIGLAFGISFGIAGQDVAREFLGKVIKNKDKD